jgi:hypothetical protein
MGACKSANVRLDAVMAAAKSQGGAQANWLGGF